MDFPSKTTGKVLQCRHCQAPVTLEFCDLGACPPTNSLIAPEREQEAERYWPLKTFVCTNCWLVQIDEMASAEDIFNDEYVYYSSFSTSWVAHAKRYAEHMMERYQYGPESRVLEIASNDGYLLQWFVKAGVPVIGVDPTANTAIAAREKGVDTVTEFFGEKLAHETLLPQGYAADLVCGCNVLAHVPDINDFVKGIKAVLKPGGVCTIEFPHLMRLVEHTQFDTIYHEHYGYLSLVFVERLYKTFGLEIFEVQELPSHEGSLRIFARHAGDETKPMHESVERIRNEEVRRGMTTEIYYKPFQQAVDQVKYDFWNWLIEQKRAGKKVAAYGAASKGVTLMNYAGYKGTDLIAFVSDANPHKQEKLLPGCRVPVRSPEAIAEYKPDYVVVLPWNLDREISQQLAYIREWGGQFVRFIPKLTVW